VHINPVLVAHQVLHVFDQNVIVIMKPTKSNLKKIFFFRNSFIYLFSSPRRNKYHPYQAPAYFDENANDPFHDENQR